MLALDAPACLTPVPALPSLASAFVVGSSGHQPRHLARQLNSNQRAVRQQLTAFAHHHLQQLSPSHVLSGMAPGWDTALATAAIQLQIPLIAVIPIAGYKQRWSQASQRRFHRLCDRAAQVITLSPDGHVNASRDARNQWLVKHSHHLLVLWNPDLQGPVARCIQYAQKQGVPTRNLWREWQRCQHQI